MATGKYMSVSTQADTEKAALAEEKGELKVNYNAEHRELAGIYASRGLDRALAGQATS
jgi:VIT1/CCC1 family predicted Fe2+/Mn2+ transporter